MADTDNRTDILVIGGGVMGLMSAVEMLNRGKTVRLIDKNLTGQTRTHVGEMALFSGDPVLENLTLQSRPAWLDIHKRYGADFGVAQRGTLELANTKGRVVLTQVEAQHGSQDNPIECLMDNAAIAAKAGTMIGPDVLSAKWEPNTPVISTHTVMQVLRKLFDDKGGVVWEKDEVTELILDESDGNKRLRGIRTKTGKIAYAEETILAAGAMTHILLETLNLRLPLRPARQHLATYELPEPFGQVMVTHRMRRGHVMMKRLANGPIMVAYDGLMDPTQATYSHIPDDSMMELLHAYLCSLIPALKTARHLETQIVTGAITPDFRPVIGRWPGVMGMWVATGLAGRNYAYAAVLAQTLGQVLSGEMPPINLAPFAPDRFELDRWPRFQRPPSLAWNEQATFSGKAKFASQVNTTGSGPAEFANNVQMTGEKKVQIGGTGEVKIREKTRGKVQMGGIGRKL